MKLLSAILLFLCALCALVIAEEDCKDKSRSNDHDSRLSLDYFNIHPYLYLPKIMRDFQPWRYVAAPDNLKSSIKLSENNFEIHLDVQDFAPEEISVKIIDDYVVVKAEHEEKKDDDSYVMRKFIRRYAIPKGVKSEDVIARLSSDGVLVLSAPVKLDGKESDRVLEIMPTGPVRKPIAKEDDTCKKENCNEI